MTYDLKITGGTIVDGTGRPGFAGDLGIKDGKVVALGKADGRARADHRRQPARSWRRASSTSTPTTTPRSCWDRMLSISPWHGVTTTVIGQLRLRRRADQAPSIAS